MTTADTTAADPRMRQVRQALWAGLALQLALAVLPLLDLATLDTFTAHVEAAYPDWSAGDVALDRNAIAWSLVGVGALGAVGWIFALLRARRTAPRITATVLFALGLLTSLTLLGTGGEQYEQIVPLGYGLLGLLPVLAGLAALVAVWRTAR
ncbi:hypothetical protein ACFQS3_21875 [Glycomyces mayteni]|uniref:Uncharacterized protein n=1 Tax=Glycomyces mayteni TaxID=543887 RepID=A0ABW2DBU1_9ACTN|nr:hypothetical protein GCM10025732_35600 [Glycomyces mayteni]